MGCKPFLTWGQAEETVRGGSWNNNQRNARVANRNRNNPHNSNNNIGFRAVSHDFRNADRQCPGW
ncbi:MAG: SUMF1/EgtB/PvdO family nonheme iron enzyme [Chloroflexi bacterium]|nr:SUMF1/EgtB/PvdO family nonheme iron enzyme [Chloroflexota bacterium]